MYQIWPFLVVLALAIGFAIGARVNGALSRRKAKHERQTALDKATMLITNGFIGDASLASDYIASAIDSLLDSAYGSTKIKDAGLKAGSLTKKLNDQCQHAVTELLEKLREHSPYIDPAATHKQVVAFLRAGGLLYSDFTTSKREVEGWVLATVADHLHAKASEMGEVINNSDVQKIQRYTESLKPYYPAGIPLATFYDNLRSGDKSYVGAVKALADDLKRQSNISTAMMPMGDAGPAVTSATAS